MSRPRLALPALVLVALILAAVSALAAPAWAESAKIPSSSFVPSTGCRCHGEYLTTWQQSMHSRALQDPVYQAKVRQAATEGGPEVAALCNHCHSPIGSMSGELTGADAMVTVSDVAREGVTCDFCHSVNGTLSPLGNGSFTVDPNGTRRGPLKDPDPPHSWAYSQLHTSAEFCGMCHDMRHPTNGLRLEDTYSEWKASDYAKSGVTCQDCHMTPGPGVTKPNEGAICEGGAVRPHIYTMTFVGANYVLGDQARAKQNLSAAAKIAILAPEVAPDSADVTVTVTNVGAGHSLPTGLTEVREMWLDIVATKVDGSVVASRTVRYGTVLKDKDGKPHAEVWDAVAIASDKRIPAGGSDTATLKVPMTADGTVKVSAVLRYAPFPAEVGEKGGFPFEPYVMASAQKQVYGSAEAQGKANEQAGADVADAPPAENGGAATGFWIVLLLAVVAVAGLVVWRMRSYKA